MTFRPSTAVALLSTLALAVPSVARAQIPDSAIPLQTILTETNRFRAEYADNYNTKNVAAVVAMYAPDAIVTTEDGTTFMGRDAVQAYFAKNASVLPHIIIHSDSMIAFGHTAIDVGTTTIHPQGGGEQTSKYLVVLRRGYKDWSIVRLSLVGVPAKKM